MYIKIEEKTQEEEESEIKSYSDISNPKHVGKAYLKHKKIKSKSKKRTLIELL